MFAFRTRWQCISIDPMLKVSKIPYWEANVNRLKCIPKRIEEVNLSFEKILIVAVHSHANMANTLNSIKAKHRSMIAIECCKSYDHPIIIPKAYRDAGIWSPKNLVKCWIVI